MNRIYGTGPTPFGAEAGRFSETEKEKNGKPKFIAAWDWRCTTKPGKIYAHIFKWPDNGKFELPAVKNKVVRAWLLADPKPRKLKFKQTRQGVSLTLPDPAPDAIASVVCLEIRDARQRRNPQRLSRQAGASGLGQKPGFCSIRAI